MSPWLADLRHAWNALRRTPGFLVTTVGTLALAIGAAAGMFGVVNTVLLRPLPYPDADRLVIISGVAPGTDLTGDFALGNDFYLQYKEQSKLIDGIFLFSGGTSTFRTAERVERLRMAFPTNGIYATLGVRPQAGRLPLPEDGTNAIVISDRLWTEWFGRDTAVIGRSYFTSGQMRQVVGVMPAGFAFPNENDLLWVAGEVQLSDVQPGNLGTPVVARMKPGVTREQLAAELTQISKSIPERFGGSPNYAKIIAAHQAVVSPLLDALVGPTLRTSLWVLLGAAMIVLVIACANVTNLFLVRVEGRQRDLAVRRALGASAGQLVRLQLSEGAVVAGLAGIAAVLLSANALPLFLRAAPEGIPRLSSVHLDLPTIAAAFVLVAIVTLACSIIPAMRAASPDLRRLREGGRTGTERSRWGRDALVAAQTALALVLLIGSALLVRSVRALRDQDPGYDTKDLYTFQYAPQQEGLRDGPSYGRLHLAFMDELRALPGTQLVGVVNNIPLDEGTGTTRFLTEAMANDAPGIRLQTNFSGGDYYRAMGIDLLKGRIFSNDEAIVPNASVIVSRSAADQLWPGQDPLGQRVRRASQPTVPYTVVGVVADVKQNDWRDETDAGIYFPLTGPTDTSWAMGSPAYVVKSSRAGAIRAEVRELVRKVAPEAPVYREYTMEFLADRAMVQLSFTTLTLGIVAALALLLGAVGLYGVLSYIVAERTKEIGVRMALGATAASVQRMVVRQGSRIVLIGVVVGVGVALASTRLLGRLLYGVSAMDPLVFGLTSVALIAVGIVASWLPARRASLVDPLEAIRGD